ncbi:hypothetical protein ACWCQ1_30525 [Streptomyces sp. NPDC002144]|uniref:hypothetical protein n=1 Tax=Streptomyces sp. NPDC006668 TaxID=3156903 RepID=UPI0033E2E863
MPTQAPASCRNACRSRAACCSLLSKAAVPTPTTSPVAGSRTGHSSMTQARRRTGAEAGSGTTRSYRIGLPSSATRRTQRRKPSSPSPPSAPAASSSAAAVLRCQEPEAVLWAEKPTDAWSNAHSTILRSRSEAADEVPTVTTNPCGLPSRSSDGWACRVTSTR